MNRSTAVFFKSTIALAAAFAFAPRGFAADDSKQKSEEVKPDEPKKTDDGKKEEQAGSLASREQIDKEKAKARDRMRADQRKYSKEQLTDAEQMYQVANKSWRSPDAKKNLEALVKKYPKFNRTGCAVLYLAQYSKGEDREKYLNQAVNDFSDCFYGDGVQVGAYARYLLAMQFKDTENPEKSAEVLRELIKKYPSAVTHNGDELAKIAKEDLDSLPATARTPAPAPAAK